MQTRKIDKSDAGIKQALKFNRIDSTIALNIAFFVNAAILVLAATVFFKTGKMPEVLKPASMIPAAELVPEKAMPEAADMKDAPMSDDSP